MSLQVWLPFINDTKNQGLNLAATANQTVNGYTQSAIGKLGKAYAGYGIYHLSSDFLGNTWSLATWFSSSSFGPYNNIILCKNNTSSTDCHIYWSVISNNSFNVGINGPSGTTSYSYTFATDTWYHLATTYDGARIKMYINGELVKDVAYTSAKAEGKMNLGIGCRSQTEAGGNPTGLWSAKYNDFRIYDHCLSQAEIHEIAKGKMIHLKLANNGFGNPNLITRSTFTSAPWAAAITGTETYKGKEAIIVRDSTLYTQTSSGTTSIFPAVTFAANTQYTVSVDWCDHLRSDGVKSGLYIRFKYSDNTYTQIISPASDPDAEWTHAKLTSTAGKTVSMMTTTYANSGSISIANLKLEVGAQETAYSPPTDELDNLEYDCSGYRHDATKNAITPVFDSARYGAAAVFNGSSSYVKVNDNTWMTDGLTEFTVSIWMKASSWPTQIRPFCCLESGGFGLGNAGDSGYYRYYIHEYRNADHSSYDYNNDTKALKISDLSTTEWNHVVAVYTTSYTKIYLNGELHHNWTRTSYGIHFNTGARLFLGCEASAASPYTPYFNGQLSDFRLYATALSEEDIKILYHTSGFVDNQGNVFAGELREV